MSDWFHINFFSQKHFSETVFLMIYYLFGCFVYRLINRNKLSRVAIVVLWKNLFSMPMFKPVPYYKGLALSKFKAFCETNKLKFVCHKLESIFSFSRNVFKRFFPWGHQKLSLCCKRLRWCYTGFILEMKTMGPYGPLNVKKRGHFQILGARYFWDNK